MSDRSASTLIRREAWSRRAAGVLADSTTGTTGTGILATSWEGSELPKPLFAASGACSRIAWALVPLMPNDDTPTRRTRPVSGHSTVSVASSTAPEVQSTWADGSSTCSVLGTIPCRIARTDLMIAATPAAACVWPMLDLTDPSSSGVSRS
jgi:hypothetical protein